MDWTFLLWAWLGTTPMMVGLWVAYHWHYRNAVLADVGFCVGFGLVSIGFGLMASGEINHRIVVAVMGAGYAFRLGTFLFCTRIVNMAEDARYQALREKSGDRAEWYFFVYFIGQALAITVLSMPLMVLMVNPNETWSVWEIGGILVWVIGVGGETLADYQLHCFRRQFCHSGKACRTGLWRYSRHPNYFFEGVHWCAYVIMSVGISYGWLTLAGPVLMMGALLKVSGVPLAEAQALANRGDDYRDYQRTTNTFIPWFPQQGHIGKDP